jgi:alpha-tubulin suppressor-like RCC1 family protein
MRCPRLPIASLLCAALAAAASGCGEEDASPTGPGSAPAATVAAPTALVFAQISASRDHSCGTTTDGRAWCWGSNELGQLGVPLSQSAECSPTRPCSTRPVAVGGALRFRHVVAGWEFTCGVTTGDRVFCWGANDAGQLGSGSTAAFNPTPVSVAGNRRYRQVRVGFRAACAITMARAAFCWGANNAGQLGNGSTTPSRIPVRIPLDVSWVQLTMGQSYGCGIITVQRQVWCWGSNGNGQFGNGSVGGSQLLPVPGGGGLGFAQIEAGFNHTCGVLPDGRAFCWGEGFGVGDGSPQGNHPTPTPVAGKRNWARITAGTLFSCGVTATARGFCWGSGAAGALGNGTNLNQFKPVAVAGSLSFVAISAGLGGHACGVATNGQGWCWGDNLRGQLGDGSLVTKMAPAPVLGPAS